MKLYKNIAVMLILGLCASTAAASEDKFKGDKKNYIDNDELFLLQKNIGLTSSEIESLYTHTVIHDCIVSGCGNANKSLAVSDPIASYEAPFPHKTQVVISPFEKTILAAYLDHTDDIRLAKFLAIYHLSKCSLSDKIDSGSDLKHSIIANYFLNRVQDLGGKDRWVNFAVKQSDEKLNKLNRRQNRVLLEENHPAQIFFNDAFFDHEENRYLAQEKLLDDYVAHPNNVYTSFLNVAVNNWIAGEASYDDPTLVYNFLLTGFFAFHTMDLSQQAEQAWVADPVNNKRFRLASIVGGFSAMQRRSLAKMHHDNAAIAAIDTEHREWQKINRAFHAFTIGLTFFDEEDHFLEAYAAWEDAFEQGTERPELITVQDRPRYTFNLEGMFVTRADFALKLGDIPTAYTYLAIAQSFMPNSAYWDYGRDAIQHRQVYAGEIAARYANDNPADDPTPFMVKRHKWGGPDSVCQVCHQRQSKVWTETEKNTILLAPDDILTVGIFPQKLTTWYGAIKDLK